MMRRLAAVAVLVFALPAIAHADLTDAEKKLLQGAMTTNAAFEAGKRADTAALEHMVGLGDADLVRAFGSGMDVARVKQMPPDIEAIVVAHFDDPRVGAALRAMPVFYQSRKLFDLHYARIQAAYKADEPSFKEILRTNQPGIDDALMRIADKFPPGTNDLPPVMLFVAQRHNPAVVPQLVASIDRGYKVLGRVAPIHNRPMGLLLDYPDPAVWRQASDELERLKRAGQVTDEAYAAGRQQLDRALADPAMTIARMKARDARVTFDQRAAALAATGIRIETLKDDNPRLYASEQAKYLARLEEIARDIGDAGVAYDVAGQYFQLGMLVRFKLRDPREAAELFAKGAQYHHALCQVALADTYQLGLGDRDAALAAYERALAEARTPTEGRIFWPYARVGDSHNNFWQAWLTHEIEFVRTGKPFRGAVPEKVITGFFDVIYGNANGFLETMAEDAQVELRPIPGFASNLRTRVSPMQRVAPPPRDWDEVVASLDKVQRDGLAQKLADLPASRLWFFLALRPVSALPTADMLRFFARNDPSGYWTTCLLGTVRFLDAQGAQRQDLAVKTGTAQLVPGIAAAGKPNALSSAATQFLASRGLRIKREGP
jgi:tetratricopeptide (TPR) repeat protein